MSTGPVAPTGRLRAADTVSLDALYGKVTARLLTLFFFCFFAAYLDRVNIDLAKLQMLDALGFSDRVYGLGAGLFFVGYIAFEIPYPLTSMMSATPLGFAVSAHYDASAIRTVHRYECTKRIKIAGLPALFIVISIGLTPGTSSTSMALPVGNIAPPGSLPSPPAGRIRS